MIITVSWKPGLWEREIDQVPPEWGREVMAAVYQAEVREARETAMARLTALAEHCRTAPCKRVLARARALILAPAEFPSGKQPDVSEEALTQSIRVLVFSPEGPLVRMGHQWMRPGDWLDRRFILEIHPHQLVLESAEGEITRIPLPTQALHGDEDYTLWMRDANISVILTFLCRRMGLGSFVPEHSRDPVSGTVKGNNWHELLEDVAQQADLSWTRRHENVVFERLPDHQETTLRIPAIRQQDLRLGLFLQSLAEALDADLIMDPKIDELAVGVDIHNQAWDEVMDCLSIVHHLRWSLVTDSSSEQRSLIVLSE